MKKQQHCGHNYLITCAACLRAAGQLWPQNLTDEELDQEHGAISADTGLITRRMLQDEYTARHPRQLTHPPV